MKLSDKITKKLLQSTSDKTELNKKALKVKNSFAEVDKFLSSDKKKEK